MGCERPFPRGFKVFNMAMVWKVVKDDQVPLRLSITPVAAATIKKIMKLKNITAGQGVSKFIGEKSCELSVQNCKLPDPAGKF